MVVLTEVFLVQVMDKQTLLGGMVSSGVEYLRVKFGTVVIFITVILSVDTHHLFYQMK